MANIQVHPFTDADMTFEVNIRPSYMFQRYNDFVLGRRLGKDVGMNLVKTLGWTRLQRIDVW